MPRSLHLGQWHKVTVMVFLHYVMEPLLHGTYKELVGYLKILTTFLSKMILFLGKMLHTCFLVRHEVNITILDKLTSFYGRSIYGLVKLIVTQTLFIILYVLKWSDSFCF